jgi:outer membrane lipoprotein-sorting protein
MTRSNLLFLALALSLASAAPVANAASASASEQLLLIDKTTGSGALSLVVTTYGAASPKSGKRDAGERNNATLLFERPDRFKLVLDPGGKNERRIVGDGDTVRWLDLATGLQGKAKASDVTDPTVLALLGTVAELGTYAPAKDIALAKGSPVSGARLVPVSFGAQAVSVNAWLHAGQPAGFAVDMADGGRVFVAVLAFKANVALKPSDFEL